MLLVIAVYCYLKICHPEQRHMMLEKDFYAYYYDCILLAVFVFFFLDYTLENINPYSSISIHTIQKSSTLPFIKQNVSL